MARLAAVNPRSTLMYMGVLKVGNFIGKEVLVVINVKPGDAVRAPVD